MRQIDKAGGHFALWGCIKLKIRFGDDRDWLAGKNQPKVCKDFKEEAMQDIREVLKRYKTLHPGSSIDDTYQYMRAAGFTPAQVTLLMNEKPISRPSPCFKQ